MSQDSRYDYPCRLYLISPPKVEIETFAKQLDEIFSAGDVGAFQLRLKDASDEEIIAASERIIPLCKDYEVAFILNDRADIADQVGADGVHLGQEDLEEMSISKARDILGPDAVIGVSCHDSSHMAMQAGEKGADYVAFGAFYPTESKAPEKLAKYGTPDVDMIEWWYQYTVLPCVAIGGMRPDNCQPMARAGADFIAVINGVWKHDKGPVAAVREFNCSIKEALKQRKPLEAA